LINGRERRTHLDGYQLRYRQAEFPGQSRADDLGDERLRP
jgi:hypothetical protein